MRPVLTALAALVLIGAAACEKPAEAPAVPAETEPAKPAFEIDPAIPTDADSIADGREIALNNCAICHSIDDQEME